MRDFAVVHNTIQADLIHSGFNNCSRHVRHSLAYYDANVEHDAPRDAFAMMRMGIDTWKKFMNTTDRWTATVKTKPRSSPPAYATRSAAKAAAKDDEGGRHRRERR